MKEDQRSYRRNFCSRKKKAYEKIQACMGFKLLTSAIPVQRSPIERTLDLCNTGAAFFLATAKVVLITAMIFFHMILHPAVLIYDFHVFITST